MGISPAQLTVISYGKDKPVCTDRLRIAGEKSPRPYRRAELSFAPPLSPDSSWVLFREISSGSTLYLAHR
jgi:hypothetical protein